MTQERAITEQEAAEKLGLAVATLRAWRYRCTGPRFVRFGRAVRYMPSDIETFINDSMVQTGTSDREHEPLQTR